MLTWSRFFAGLGSSMYVATVPIFISEISVPRTRGMMVGLFGICLSVGYALSSWLGVAFSFVEAGNVQWRIPLAITGVPSLILLMIIQSIPESPRWLLMNDRLDEASEVLRRLHNSPEDADQHSFAEMELFQIKEQVAFEKLNYVTWREFMTSKRYRRRVWTAASIFWCSQVCYPYSLTSFLPVPPPHLPPHPPYITRPLAR